MDSSFFMIYFLTVASLFTKVHCSHCDATFYNPVSDCSTNPLRVGYYPSPACGSLHVLADSDGRPNAEFARLNYASGSDSYHHEYSAGRYLSIKLTKSARIHGIAVEGSPNSLRYYLKSMEIWYKVTVNNFNVALGSSTSESFYKEAGVTKRFIANMQTATKFVFTQPLFADELRIHPITFYGDRVFRVELYGCYLGKVSLPSSIGMDKPLQISVDKSQDANLTSYRYYVKITEPNGTMIIKEVYKTLNYTFVTRGKGMVELGLNYSTGWLSTDKVEVLVQGPINGLEMKLDGNNTSPFVKKAGLDIEFYLGTADQPYQIKSYQFAFGDASSLTHNYCKHRFKSGIHNVTGTASNDFYFSNVTRTVVACATTTPSIQFQPHISGAIRVEDLGPSVLFNITVTFYALHITFMKASIDAFQLFNETTYGVGNMERIVTLPYLSAPSTKTCKIEYNDACGSISQNVAVYVDAKIIGVNLMMNQTFKDSLIEAVPYYFKNHPIDLYVDVTNGTTVSCSIQPFGFAMSAVVQNRQYKLTHTFTTTDSDTYSIYARCTNRLLTNLDSGSINIELREVPERIANFSLEMPNNIVRISTSFDLLIVFMKGNYMNCSITSSTAGISPLIYSYSDLVARQESHTSGGKAYRIKTSTSVISINHQLDVICRNVLDEVKGNVTFQAQQLVSGLALNLPPLLCHNETLSVAVATTGGSPLYKSLSIDSHKYLDFYSANGSANVFTVASWMYGDPGLKQITVRTWNDISSTTATSYVRIARNVTSLSVIVNFTMSSPQALARRPGNYLPVQERINFTAVVIPAVQGFIYNWSLNGNLSNASTAAPTWFYTFSDAGTYLLRLVVGGCRNTVYQRYFTVLEPVKDFVVTINPSPVVLVGSPALINVTIPANSDCIESYLGLGNATFTRCRNDSLSGQFCNFSSSVCQISLPYSVSGNYSLNFTASNRLYARSKAVTLVAKACSVPKIFAQGSGTNRNNYTGGLVEQVLRSDSLLYNVTSVNVSCELSDEYEIEWVVYSPWRSANNSKNIVPNSRFQIENNNRTLKVPCCFLSYGEFLVNITVRMIGNKLIDGLFSASTLFVAYNNDTDIVASLKRDGNISHAYNTMVSFTAEGSYDPDNFAKNLSFTWFCRDTALESRDILSISSIPVINVTYFLHQINATSSQNFSSSSAHISSSAVLNSVNRSYESATNKTGDAANATIVGCFGMPFGRLDVSNTTNSIKFNSKFLQENHTIEFVVVVEGASSLRLRRSKAAQDVFVRMRETPYFEIRCAENCAAKVNPMGKLSLTVTCKSESCKKRANFKWSLLENGVSVKLADKIYSLLTDKELYMKPDVLKKGFHYRLILKGTAYDGAVFEQEFAFSVNKPPENGTCSISPSSGAAIQTKFHINCSHWIDSELPLHYEVAHYTNILTTVVCKGVESICETIFPIGSGKNSSLSVRVRVLDALNMFTEVHFVVKVTAGKLTLEQMDKILIEIENSTDSVKTSQLIGAVASVLNAYTDPNKTNEYLKRSVKLREASTFHLARMVNLNTVDTVAPITASVAEMPSEFSQDSGTMATNAITKMTEIFSKSQVNLIFRDVVDQGKNLLAAMGMVSKSASVNLDPNKIKRNDSNTTEQDFLKWTSDVGRQLVLNNSISFDKIANPMLSRMTPYDEEVSLPTSNLGLVLRKSFSSQLNMTTTLSILNNEVTMPSLQDLDISNTPIVNLLLKVTTFNSYFWAPTSKLINSTVTEFELKSGDTPLVVKDTKQPIKLQIKRNLDRPIPFQHWRFQQRAYQERANYHKLQIENDNSMHIELKPMNYCMNYNVYVKYGSRPSRDDYYKNWTLPDMSTCNNTGMQEDVRANICAIYREVVSPSLRNQVNGSQDHVNCSLMAVLQKRIKEALKLCSSDPYKIFLLDSETKNGIYYIGIYENDRQISQEAMPAMLYNSSNDCQVADVMGESSYFLRGYTSKCRYWTTAQAEDWLTQGCQVEKETDPSTVHCSCNHLTSFAADFFIAPNPIDIDKVIEGFKNIQDNVSVLVLISVLCAFYIFLVVYLRRRDNRDAEKVDVTVIDNDASKPYEYLIIFVTGARINAGSTAHVFCCLNSAKKLGEPKLLFDSEKPSFQRDQINAFKVSYSDPVDDITDIRLWHDNTGDSPGWYLSRIYVEDLQTNKRSLFICERWFAVEFEDGLIDRTVPVASYQDQKVFTHLFTTKAAQDLSDQHLWLSVALKRAHDTFTRVQRLTCCMSLLFTTMLASAMFFQLGNNSKYLWKIGSLVIDYKGIIIGIQSGFVVIPVNFVIAWFFRHSESFAVYRRRREKRKITGETVERKMMLPCGFVIIAWFLAIASIVASLVIVLFYSMQWGNDKSQQFVLSVFTSFVQSAFLIQPVKLVLVAMVLALILKRGTDETDILDTYKYCGEEREANNEKVEIDMSKLQTSPLTEEQLIYARKRRQMEIRLKLFLQDFLSYLLFLTFLFLVVRGYRDPNEYYFRKALQDDVVHRHFTSVQDIPGLWTWVQQHFIPALYTQQWYNGDNFTNFKMLQNQEAFRIGLARIRQLRMRPGSCKVYDDMNRYFNTCDAFYSLSLNEERNFDIAWKNLVSSRKRRDVIEEDMATENGFQEILDAGNKDELKNSPGSLNSAVLSNLDSPPRRNVEMVEKRKLTRSLEATGDNIELNVNLNSENLLESSYDDETILKRTRRALKFKIKRKTIQTSSVLKHPDAVLIDEQYLLPNGQVRPNKDNWIYHDMSSLRGFPYYGYFATYSGGGYVASLSTDIDFARATAMALEQDSWVDGLTRALFFEFSVYNANLNFFATGFVMIEVLPTGSVVPNANIRVFKLYRYVGVFGKLVMASEIILVLCLFFFIYKECRHMYRLGCAYFKLFWSWIEITIAVALFTALVLRGFSWYEADKNLMKLRRNTEQFINFHYTVLADDALLLSVTIICFASTLKIIKILGIFPTFVVLKETMYRFATPLLNYTLPFCIAFFGFASLGYLLFHTEQLFSSYTNSCQTQLLMLVGGSVYYTLRQAHEVLGPLFFLMFAAFETCIMLNIFLTIINDSIKESSDWKTEARSTDFVDFIEDRVRAIFNLKPAVRKMDKKPRRSTMRKSTVGGRKSTIKNPDSIRQPSNRKLTFCEPIVITSMPRKVTAGEAIIAGSTIRKSSIHEVFGRKKHTVSRKDSYFAGTESTPVKSVSNDVTINVEISVAADEIVNLRQKRKMELLLRDRKAKRHTKELHDKCLLNLQQLSDWMENSIEEECDDVKLNLMFFSMYY